MLVGVNPAKGLTTKDIWSSRVGKFLLEVLDQANVDVRQIYFTNVHLKPTPCNRPLTRLELTNDSKRLAAEVKKVKPKLIIALGRQASQALSLQRIDHREVYHPSFVKRFGGKDEYINQFNQLCNQIN